MENRFLATCELLVEASSASEAKQEPGYKKAVKAVKMWAKSNGLNHRIDWTTRKEQPSFMPYPNYLIGFTIRFEIDHFVGDENMLVHLSSQFMDFCDTHGFEEPVCGLDPDK